MKDYISLNIFSICQYSRLKEKSQHRFFFRPAIVLFCISLENMQTKPNAQMHIAVYQEAKWISELLSGVSSLPWGTAHFSLHDASAIACVDMG